MIVASILHGTEGSFIHVLSLFILLGVIGLFLSGMFNVLDYRQGGYIQLLEQAPSSEAQYPPDDYYSQSTRRDLLQQQQVQRQDRYNPREPGFEYQRQRRFSEDLLQEEDPDIEDVQNMVTTRPVGEGIITIIPHRRRHSMAGFAGHMERTRLGTYAHHARVAPELNMKTRNLPAVNFSLSYFGEVKNRSGNPSVKCMHGPLECAGNKQQLCFKKFFPAHETWFSFVLKMNSHRPSRIGEEDYAREIGEMIVGNSALLDKVGECARGEEGLDLLIASVENTKRQGAKASCTVFIDNKKRCVIDGGVWRECPGGSTAPDFVRSIEEAATPLKQAKSRLRLNRFRLNCRIQHCTPRPVRGDTVHQETAGQLGDAAMAHSIDDDFDFADLGDLDLDMEERAMLAGAGVHSRNTSSASTSRPLTSSSRSSASTSTSAAATTAHAHDEFDDFGGLEDVLLNDDLLTEAAVPTTSIRSAFFQAPKQGAAASHALQQQQQQQHRQAQPTKLFPIFGGNNNPPPARAPAPSAPSWSVPAPSRNMIPRSDPSNDFAADIFRSPEAPQQMSAAPTHHEIDKKEALTWQYPINYPRRDYQYNIIRRALFTNTLVSLPTGLGKTFIAAVVMLNFFRWFPKSKIIFMAPTRPLVNQQIEACFNICGIPQQDTVELTGHQNADVRKDMWIRKRVVFCTPQVLQNDLKSGICPAEDIVCLVVDEAHRATGRYAYAEVIRLLEPLNRDIRIMALTATPGGDIRTVQQVVQNLKIAKIELRTEDSMDLQQFVFKRTVQEMVVPCGRELGEIRDKFVRMMRPFLDRLAKQGVLRTTDPGQLSRFALLQGKESFVREHPQHSGTKSFILKQISICMGLVHAYELLTVHGIRPFFSNMDPYASIQQDSGRSLGGARGGAGSKRKNNEDEWDKDDENKPSPARKAMEEIPDFMRMMDGIRSKMKLTSFVSHPKLERLVGVVVQHFIDHQDESDALARAKAFERADSAGPSSTTTAGSTEATADKDGATPQTRVMIFANYRESVEEISRVLDSHRPLIKVQSFIGQSTAKGKKGITQKEQQKVVADFQKGEHNVLVATSIGEEGLDIGDVDLIVCYDSHSSPIRMLQRMGRTGRKRKGKICLLLAEGQEEQKYRRSQTSYKTVQRAIAQGQNIQYYPHSPRILPPGPPPTCDLVHVHVPTYITPATGRKRRRLEDGTPARAVNQSAFLDQEELARFQHRYLIPKRNIRLITFQTACETMLGPKRKSVMTPDKTIHVGHSTRTMKFISSVNQVAKARLDQSLAPPTENTIEKDPYSMRMMALLKQAEELQMDSEDQSSDDAPIFRRGRARMLPSDDEDDTIDGYQQHHDDLDNSTLFGDQPKKKIRPKPKRKNPVANATTAPASLITARPAVTISPSPSPSPPQPPNPRTSKSFFQTISDDEVDMEIMGGLGKGFSQSNHQPSPEFDDFLLVELASQDESWQPHGGRKGFSFQEPLTPPTLWYKAEEDEDRTNGMEQEEHPSMAGETQRFTVVTLPPVPERGIWYMPGTKNTYSSSKDNDPGIRSGLDSKELEGKVLLVIDSSDDELDKEDLAIFKPPEMDEGKGKATAEVFIVEDENEDYEAFFEDFAWD
ncbi:hypothetical protein BGZ75_010190 [Mortierella antarctica]|nr:hypothetical protein BGZ75_010190 [Mortierella antarctica]